MAKAAKRRGGSGTLIQRSRAISPQQKAIWHNVSGAGRSKVKREFFALSAKDEDDIERMLETRVDVNLQRGAQ